MNLSSITAKYINKPFKECGCIDFVVDFMRDIGKPLPDEVNGFNTSNYRDLLKTDIKAAQIEMIRAFRKIGDPASIKYPATGDLLVILQKRHFGLFPAVAIGNGNAMASFIRRGVIPFKLDQWNFAIMARRVS